MTKDIVILGASLGGIPIAHYLLKHTALEVQDLKVTIVAPNSHFFWNFAAVRGIVPDQLGDDKLFYPIAPTFKKYPSSKYEIVLGKAESLDPASRAVTVRTNDGATRTITYDIVVLATGSSFREDMPFKNLSSTEETKKALHTWQQRVRSAKSIVVAGAGATGLEVAGELAEEYAKKGTKEITLISDKELPLDDRILPSVRKAAKNELEKLNARVIVNATVTGGLTSGPNGQNTIEITKKGGKKETLKADLFIPTYGVVPNTNYLPASLLDARGFVKTTPTLNAEGHDDIFVVGDVQNLQPPQGVLTDTQVNHLAKALHILLTKGERSEYKPDSKVMMAASVGKNRGTGQMGTFKLFSIMVWFFKGRYLGTDYAAELVAGNRTVQQKSW